ncbi:glutathione S-transferase-like [Anabrus simplex]|uniref:glutathione S-transferase-like n=1 Tax=Anabrus simplex TaxID=316456 RepID=UPI0035A358A7
MAPKYKLTYFDFRGLGEPIRYLLSYGGADFEDNRIKMEDWPKFKSSTPYGKMPLLEVDGKEVYQSLAICRYLAKQFKLIGSNDWEALQIDCTVDTITDLRLAISGAYYYEENEEAKAKKIQILQKETLPMYLSKLDKQVKDNGGHFVGGKLTWADLYFASVNDTWGVVLGKLPTDDYPNLKVVYDKVNALPAIKAWIAKRPVTQW